MKKVLVALGMTLLAGGAQASAGNILFALGHVQIQRGSQVIAAQRGTPVEVGDTITTGPTGMSQVRLKDGALLSLRYGSSMKVEEFKLPAPAPVVPAASTSQPVSGGGGRSVLRLLRGAFRTVTGLIGKGAGDTYSVVTPVATIGIRGTDYSAALCVGDCGATKDGLWVGVSAGEIELNNNGGTLVLTNDQYGYVPDAGTQGNQELEPPEVLEVPIETPGGDESGGTSGGDAAPPSEEGAPENSFTDESSTAGNDATGNTQPEGDYELVPGAPGLFAFASSGYKGAAYNSVYTDDAGALNGYLTNVFASIGSAQNFDVGSDSATGLQWGRWSGGVAVVDGNGLDLSAKSLHWIYALADSTPQMPNVTGDVSYRIVGFTTPTDDAGVSGVFGDAQLHANFVTGAVTSTLNLGINNEAWVATGTGSIGAPLFSGSYSLTVNDAVGSPIAGSGGGQFAGFFTDQAMAAGLSYELNYTYQAGGSNTLTGVVGFERIVTVP